MSFALDDLHVEAHRAKKRAKDASELAKIMAEPFEGRSLEDLSDDAAVVLFKAVEAQKLAADAHRTAFETIRQYIEFQKACEMEKKMMDFLMTIDTLIKAPIYVIQNTNQKTT